MADPIPTAVLATLAEDVRALLRRADALDLLDVAIHLDLALLRLVAIAPAGAIDPEPYDWPDEPDGITLRAPAAPSRSGPRSAPSTTT